MPRRVDAKTNWRPVDIMEAGSTIWDQLPERQIWNFLVTTLPNGDLLGDRAIAAFAVVQEALIIFIKARIDHQGRARGDGEG